MPFTESDLLSLSALQHLMFCKSGVSGCGKRQLYEQLGFRRVGPHYRNPLPGVTYWELDLSIWEEGVL